MALKTSEVVAALAMQVSYSHKGMRQDGIHCEVKKAAVRPCQVITDLGSAPLQANPSGQAEDRSLANTRCGSQLGRRCRDLQRLRLAAHCEVFGATRGRRPALFPRAGKRAYRDSRTVTVDWLCTWCLTSGRTSSTSCSGLNGAPFRLPHLWRPDILCWCTQPSLESTTAHGHCPTVRGRGDSPGSTCCSFTGPCQLACCALWCPLSWKSRSSMAQAGSASSLFEWQASCGGPSLTFLGCRRFPS